LRDKRVYLESLGCSKNLVDSEVMLGKLSEYELTDSPNLADVIIVNTCGFINSAKEESINRILTLADERKFGSTRSLVSPRQIFIGWDVRFT